MKNQKAPKKILLVRTDRIGDVILSTPVIKNLRLAFPAAYIAFMVCPYTQDVLAGNPYLDEVIVYDKHCRQRSIFQSIKFSWYLRKKKFDWAIILHPTNRAHLITFLAGIPCRVGWNKKMAGLLTVKVADKKQEGQKHESEYTLDILRRLNVPVADKNLYFPIKEAATKKVKVLLGENGVKDGEQYIVVHPSASCPSKRWPEEYFSQLISLLKQKLGMIIVVVAFLGEGKFAEEVVTSNEVVDLRGKLTVSELGSLLNEATLFISNDSGPVHIAASLNTPVISIFGRKDPGLSPVRWKPLGENSFYFHKDVGCRFCFAHNCKKGFLCLKAVKPQEVVEKAMAICRAVS